MKKKVALTVCATALVATMAVGGTLAYLTQTTDTVKNVFTGEDDDLDGKIEERFDSETAKNFLPGDAIYKEPKLVNDQSSVDAWVAVKVTFDANGEAISYATFDEKYGTIQTKTTEGFVDGFNTADYEDITPEGADYKLFAYKTVVTKGSSTSTIFDQVVVEAGIETIYNSESETTVVWKEVKKADFDAETDDSKKLEENGRYYIQTSVTASSYESSADYFVEKDGQLVSADISALPTFNVNVTGYMVQAKNVDFATAKTQLTELATKYAQ